MSAVLTFMVFASLVAMTVARRESSAALLAKPWRIWVLDGVGLTVQGVLIPLVQVYVLMESWAYVAADFRGRLPLWGPAAFLLNFVLVDYLYYWNHRLLHGRRLWSVHAVHHTVTDMDVLGTSRNTVWSSFLLLYVWVNSALVFLVSEPEWYAAGATATACLDLWRHSLVEPRKCERLLRGIGLALILPEDHAWHHSDTPRGSLGGVNFGANLNVWDRLHGTFYRPGRRPFVLGAPVTLSVGRQLTWPFSS